MATKTLKTIEVTLISCEGGDPITVSDTATEPKASNALYQFEHEQYMVLDASQNDITEFIYVPFHAVDNIVVTEESTEVPDKGDVYGCEGGV